MRSVRHLAVSRERGVEGDVNPGAGSPRQLLVTSSESLAPQAIDEPDARCNIVLRGRVRLEPGALLEIGEVALRITMRCTPCARGARLAGVPAAGYGAAEFGTVPRHLAAVVRGGSVRAVDRVSVRRGVFERPPEHLRDRCAWAVNAIPAGTVVSTRELLRAVGADPAYARAMPAWLVHAGRSGAPVHRVLRGGVSAVAEPSPSWAPDAYARLAAESSELREHRLGEALWFHGSGVGSIDGSAGA